MVTAPSGAPAAVSPSRGEVLAVDDAVGCVAPAPCASFLHALKHTLKQPRGMRIAKEATDTREFWLSFIPLGIHATLNAVLTFEPGLEGLPRQPREVKQPTVHAKGARFGFRRAVHLHAYLHASISSVESRVLRTGRDLFLAS